MNSSWVPGHADIEENEKADQAAKQAAAQSLTGGITQYPKLKSVRPNAIRQAIKLKRQNEWTNGREDSCQLRNVTRRPNTTSGAQIHQQLGNALKLGSARFHRGRGDDA
jgi:hypothetical protein